jgi:hypothetical protein
MKEEIHTLLDLSERANLNHKISHVSIITVVQLRPGFVERDNGKIFDKACTYLKLG